MNFASPGREEGQTWDMPQRAPLQPTPKLLALQKDFQQISAMAGYLNSSFDPPQLRLFFTLYARVLLSGEAEGWALTPVLQAWTDALCVRLREDSSSAIMPPQVNLSAPQLLPNGETWYLVATVNFGTKVTDNSYLRVRNAVLSAYQGAVALREPGALAAWAAQRPPAEASGVLPAAVPPDVAASPDASSAVSGDTGSQA
jgi:hypothetical protein